MEGWKVGDKIVMNNTAYLIDNYRIIEEISDIQIESMDRTAMTDIIRDKLSRKLADHLIRERVVEFRSERNPVSMNTSIIMDIKYLSKA